MYVCLSLKKAYAKWLDELSLNDKPSIPYNIASSWNYAAHRYVILINCL
jgi:hypothetical protein